MNGKGRKWNVTVASDRRYNKLLEVKTLRQIDGVGNSAPIIRVWRMRNTTSLKDTTQQREVCFMIVWICMANKVEDLS